MLLNLSDAPTSDPLTRLAWLTGVREQAQRELDAELAKVYYDARLHDQLDDAVRIGPYAKTKVLAMTRAENTRRGRQIRWNDGADPTSSAFAG